MSISKMCAKRIKGDYRLLKKEPLEFIDAYPDEKDMLIWYYLIKGPPDSEYKNGYYIGKIMHNPEYPLKGPDYMMLTPNGRFVIDKKICLTNSAYHPESWSAIWNIRNMLDGFLSVLVADQDSGISHIKRHKNSTIEREKFANESIAFNLTHYPNIFKKFKRFVNEDGTIRTDEPIKEKKVIKEEVKEEIKEEVEEEVKKEVNEEVKKEVNEEIEEMKVVILLKSISNYKKDDLVEMCNNHNISITKNVDGKEKKLNKAELYRSLTEY
jgi:ubiquitin-conjugating enzyme E2 J2